MAIRSIRFDAKAARCQNDAETCKTSDVDQSGTRLHGREAWHEQASATLLSFNDIGGQASIKSNKPNKPVLPLHNAGADESTRIVAVTNLQRGLGRG